jgi:hypothetical protein
MRDNSESSQKFFNSIFGDYQASLVAPDIFSTNIFLSQPLPSYSSSKLNSSPNESPLRPSFGDNLAFSYFEVRIEYISSHGEVL